MRIRVFLVDDHQMMCEGLRAMFAGESGIEVVGEARDGRTALERVRELMPDVVVMDVGMPDLNGIEATRRLRAENPDLKVVGVSTYSDRRYVVNMLRAGASAYVPKTCACEELRCAIRAASEGKHYLSPDIAGLVIDRSAPDAFASRSSVYDLLGAREREVLQLLAEGRTSAEIAERLQISMRTVDTHRRNLMRKLDIHNTAELTKYAVREGLTALDP